MFNYCANASCELLRNFEREAFFVSFRLFKQGAKKVHIQNLNAVVKFLGITHRTNFPFKLKNSVITEAFSVHPNYH